MGREVPQKKREGSLEALPCVLSRYAGKSRVPLVSVRGSYWAVPVALAEAVPADFGTLK
jgi:hypothetical protein